MGQDELGRTQKKTLPDVTRKDATDNLTQGSDFEPYHHSRTRASGCEANYVREGRNASSKYHVGKRSGEYHRDVDDRTQEIEGEGGTMSKSLCTEQIGKESTPNDPLEVEDVTNASEKSEGTPRYNLEHSFGRNV